MLILTAFSKICRPTSPRWIEINIYTGAGVRRPSKNGAQGETPGKAGGRRERGGGGRGGGRKELETADWENYYSLSRSCPVVFAPPCPRSGRGFEPRVMLIALLPPAGNMYSRNARNVRTKTTCKRHIFAPPPSFSYLGKVMLPR